MHGSIKTFDICPLATRCCTCAPSNFEIQHQPHQAVGMRLVEARAARKLVNNLNQKGARNQASIGFVFASQHGLLFALSWAQVRAYAHLGGHEVGGGRAVSRCGGCGIDCGAAGDDGRKKFDRRGRPHADPASDSVGAGASAGAGDGGSGGA